MKPIKYGIKFYFLCEARTGYVLDCIIYRGGHINTARYSLQLAGASLRERLSTLHGQLLQFCVPGGGTV